MRAKVAHCFYCTDTDRFILPILTNGPSTPLDLRYHAALYGNPDQPTFST